MVSSNATLLIEGYTPFLQGAASPFSKPVPYLAATLLFFLLLYSVQKGEESPHPDIPLLNPKKFWDVGEWKVKWDFIFNVRKIVNERIASHPDEPYRILTDFGDMTILPPIPYANEIRNIDDLSFNKVLEKNFQANLSGFEVFQEANLHKVVLKHVIRVKLTQFLSKVTEPLSEETALTLTDVFTENKEWHTIVLKDDIIKLVARISSRVFTGELLCRNPEWLKITADYAMTCFLAADMVRMFPAPMRRFMHEFLPMSRKVRAQLKEGRRIVTPVLEERRRQKLAALARGEPVPEFNDALEWCEEIANDVNFDPATFQLGISVAAIHTTSDFVTQVMLDLAENPEYIDPLRKEITEVLGEDGWMKLSLQKMRLLDSVCKESQRLRPIGLVAMHREAQSDMNLSGGIFLPKGSRIAISSHLMRDPTIYPNPNKFDGYRFMRMREQLGPGKDGVAHFVSSSPEHLGFGHGQHACPGRFFASNEVKIALCHILLKYEWKLAPGVVPTPFNFGYTIGCDPKAKVEIRRRDFELDVNVKEAIVAA